MNQQFKDLLASRLEELVADLRYTHKPSGQLKPPHVVRLQLPGKERSQGEAEDFPLVRWKITGGQFTRMGPALFSVEINAGIYTPGTITDGDGEISELALALGQIVNKPWYKPYKLLNSAPFAFGSTEPQSKGMQPHPYYWVSLYLEFSVAIGHGGV